MKRSARWKLRIIEKCRPGIVTSYRGDSAGAMTWREIPDGIVSDAPAVAEGADRPATPDRYEARTGSKKAERLLENGGSPATEAAVMMALKWLASNQ
ncbi:MAG: hypothetical protein AAB215_03720, partial [Planctomycetota bacterium]